MFLMLLLLPPVALPASPVEAPDAVLNGSFLLDDTGWAFARTGGTAAGGWDRHGAENGGSVAVVTERAGLAAGEGRWEQRVVLGEPQGTAVRLSYAWKKGFEGPEPLVQNAWVSVVQPDGDRVLLDVQAGAPRRYDAWQRVEPRDVSFAFDEPGAYTVQLVFSYVTGESPAAKARAWFDEVRLVVGGEPEPRPEWDVRASLPEGGGYGEAVAGTGDALYVVRCYGSTTEPRLWRYDPAANRWTRLSTEGLPDGAFRNGATLTWDGGDRLYAMEGGRYRDESRTGFWAYSIGADAWTRLADTPHAQGAGDAATWSAADGRLYAFLGSSGHGTAFARYDPVRDAWHRLADPPAGTDDGAALAWAGGDHLYALRGEWHEQFPAVQDFWRYDLATGRWEARASIPDVGGVGDGGSLLWVGGFDATLAGVLYALGGNDPGENAGYGAYAYDLADDSWSLLPDLPYPVGDYNGNRLGYAGGHVHYWQGAPAVYPGGGTRLARLVLPG